MPSALVRSAVNSRGTENRKPQNEFIPPNDHIYDFVVFR